jgi:hypothetical protein
LKAIPAKYLEPLQIVGIVYWGRSGTILLHSLLDSHPDILSCNAYFWLFSSKMDEFLASGHESCQKKLVSFVCEAFPYLFEHWPTFFPEMFRGPDRDLKFGTDRTRFIECFEEYLFCFPSGVPFKHLPDGHTIHSFVLQAIHVAYAMSQGQTLNSENPTIVWQTHFWQADYFRERFPNIRILSAVRHPYKGYDAWQMRGFVDERVPPFWYYHTVKFRQMMEFTKVPLDLYDRCRAIRFEDIHNRSEIAMRALAKWLNVRWHDSLLQSTFDGEQYWGVKGGCWHMIKSGETPPVEALVTGTRKFDEFKMDLKYLGFIDRLRMRAFCNDAFENWGYSPIFKHSFRMTCLKISRSLLLILPSKLDRLAYLEDLRLALKALKQLPSRTRFAKARMIAKSLADFVRNKWIFRKEIADLCKVQAEWRPIEAVFLPSKSKPDDQSKQSLPIEARKAA